MTVAMKRAGAASVTGYDPFPKFTAPEGAIQRFVTVRLDVSRESAAHRGRR
jgi:hypothetical protein